MSLKWGFSKATEDKDSGEVVMADQTVKKIFTSQDAISIDRLENIDVAKFYICRICGNFPKTVKVNVKCMHFYCIQCIDNFQASIDTTKCPATSEDGEACRHPTNELFKLSGFLVEIHSSIKVSCKNPLCEEYLKFSEIDEHEAACKKRGSYKRQADSLSTSRSKPLHKDADAAIGVLMHWCDKHYVSPCDFLLFALRKNIAQEVPGLEDSIEDIFERFLEKKEADIITPDMGLALKLEANLSKRQYIKLCSKKVLVTCLNC